MTFHHKHIVHFHDSTWDGIDLLLNTASVNVLPSKNQMLCEYCTHVIIN